MLTWPEIITEIHGPAINMRVKNAHVSSTAQNVNEWDNRFDCDLLLSFHLKSWPSVAADWATRSRSWPDKEMIEKIMERGAEVVPKSSKNEDLFWRLSFSRAELMLAKLTSEKARHCYLVVKIIYKRHIKQKHPFLKSYHLKTLLWHFLESKNGFYWKD